MRTRLAKKIINSYKSRKYTRYKIEKLIVACRTINHPLLVIDFIDGSRLISLNFWQHSFDPTPYKNETIRWIKGKSSNSFIVPIYIN